MITAAWILSAAIILIVVTVRTVENKKKTDPFAFEGEREKLLGSLEETRLSPAMAVKLLSRRGLSSNDVTAGLLHAAYKGAVKLEYDHTGGNHRFSDSRPDKEHEPLTEDERYLLDWLLYRVGRDGHFHVDDLAGFTGDKQKMEQYLQDLYEWEKQTIASMKAFDLYRPLSLPRMILAGTGAAGILTGSVFLFFHPFSGIAVFLAALFSLISIRSVSPHTAAGRMEEARWRTYYRMLTDINAEEIGREHLSSAFIFAVAFKVVDRFFTAFPIQEAGELKVNEEPFPLYYFAPAGSFVLSAEGIRMYEELEQGFDRVENAPVAMTDSDLPDGLD
ncbi:hypothetical protein CR205_06035 [Alteribacter lacisalsi]|uniref:Predicted membrane protein YciQ-like C-terminal domain-containing protein n=1 Tax=Alteribacter lacisalsi TaxID=2045244 RepID=A0A2W0H8G8_9BACI|nr:DUF2207 domain-containing protein [Alteribacter lacisalsi]PYZ98153.1 hypothetical protein CR205_06035 [Alteribacter lacisalsi]